MTATFLGGFYILVMLHAKSLQAIHKHVVGFCPGLLFLMTPRSCVFLLLSHLK